MNYAKVGVIGRYVYRHLYTSFAEISNRRTGVKVPDKGVRDEHGFEPMDELFSSPEKVAASTNGDNDYTVTEDTMDVVESKHIVRTYVIGDVLKGNLQVRWSNPMIY